MRRGRTHSARAGTRDWRADAPMIGLCALGFGILAATTYGIAHRDSPEASINAAPVIAAAPNDKAITGSAGINSAIKEQAARKEDRLVTGAISAKQDITGAIPAKQDIAPPAADANAKPQAAKKKPATTTAKTEAPKTFFDFFNVQQNR